MKDRDLKMGRTTYHRNGVAGEGFHCVEFLYRHEKIWTDMCGVVFEAPGHCAVLCIRLPAERWRGDHFEPHLREHIKAQEESIGAMLDREANT